MGGGGKTGNRCPGAGRRAQPATRGRLFTVSGTRGGSPWRSRARIAPAIRTNDGTLARREADERPARGPVGQRASGNKRGKSACGLARERRALRSTSQDVWDRARPPESPAQSEAAPDRHPNGPGLQARSAQRIEQVARKGSPPTRSAVCKDESVLCKRNLRDEQNINNKWLYDST